MRLAFLRALVASLLAAGALAIAALVGGGFGGLQGRILLSTLALAAASGISLAASIGWRRSTLLGSGSIGAAVAAFVLALDEIWVAHGQSEPVGKGLGVLSVLAAAAAYVVLLLAWRRPGEPRHVVVATVAGGAGTSLTAVTTCGAILWGGGDALGRVLGVFAVVGVVGTIVSVVLRRLARTHLDRDGEPLVGRRIVAVERADDLLVLRLDDGTCVVATPPAERVAVPPPG